MAKHPLCCFKLPKVFLQARGAGLLPFPGIFPLHFHSLSPHTSSSSSDFFWNMSPSGCCTKYIATVPMRGETSHQLYLLLPQEDYFEKLLYLLDACGSWAVNSSCVCQFFTDLFIFLHGLSFQNSVHSDIQTQLLRIFPSPPYFHIPCLSPPTKNLCSLCCDQLYH